MTTWPLQSQCDAFYGNPRGKNAHANPAWEAKYLVTVKPPFKMTYDGRPVSGIRFNKNAAEGLSRALQAIWIASGKNQAVVDRWGASVFGGSYNYRLKRGSSSLSMHAYGCAIDLDPGKHPMRPGSPKFAPEVIKAFTDQGAINLPNDRMHFQFARLR